MPTVYIGVPAPTPRPLECSMAGHQRGLAEKEQSQDAVGVGWRVWLGRLAVCFAVCGTWLGVVEREAFCQGKGCLCRSGLSGCPWWYRVPFEGESQAKLESHMCSETEPSQGGAHWGLSCGDAGICVCV